MLLKIKDSEKYDYDTALAWVVSAKNSLINHNGFSPSQLVFGQNPSLPNFINNKLPAQESVVKSPDIITHLIALHAARKSYIESESCNKLKTALRKNVRSSTNVMYEIGHEIFFKRDDSPKWKGPGTVLGQDGPVIFISQGSRYIKAHVCQTQPCQTSKLTNKSTDDAENSSTIGVTKEFEKPPTIDHDSINDDYIYNRSDDDSNVDIKSASIDKANSSKENDSIAENPVQGNANTKTNTVIIFKDEQERECTAQILGRAGKVTGKYKRCYNIMCKSLKELRNIKSWIDGENVTI